MWTSQKSKGVRKRRTVAFTECILFSHMSFPASRQLDIEFRIILNPYIVCLPDFSVIKRTIQGEVKTDAACL
jgi:hypothetical protein